jgi:hypothetical protein
MHEYLNRHFVADVSKLTAWDYPPSDTLTVHAPANCTCALHASGKQRKELSFPFPLPAINQDQRVHPTNRGETAWKSSNQKQDMIS